MPIPLANSDSSQHPKLLTLQQLAEEFFGITATALYCRRHRDPNSIPPSIRIPSTKSLLFSRETVIKWFASYEENREKDNTFTHRPQSIAPKKKGASTKSERIEARKLGVTVKQLRQRGEK